MGRLADRPAPADLTTAHQAATRAQSLLGVYRGSLILDLRRFFLLTGLLVIAFAAYLLAGGLHELGEAGGGEAAEVAGPILGILFALACGWMYVGGVARLRPSAARSPR